MAHSAQNAGSGAAAKTLKESLYEGHGFSRAALTCWFDGFSR
jgi:hypothetical protein